MRFRVTKEELNRFAIPYTVMVKEPDSSYKFEFPDTIELEGEPVAIECDCSCHVCNPIKEKCGCGQLLSEHGNGESGHCTGAYQGGTSGQGGTVGQGYPTIRESFCCCSYRSNKQK